MPLESVDHLESAHTSTPIPSAVAPSHTNLPPPTGGKRRRRKHGTRKGMVRKTARRAYMKSKKSGGSFLNRLLVPGALLVGQKTLQSRKKHGKGTRRIRTRRGRK
jgi:hypothetical protein